MGGAGEARGQSDFHSLIPPQFFLFAQNYSCDCRTRGNREAQRGDNYLVHIYGLIIIGVIKFDFVEYPFDLAVDFFEFGCNFGFVAEILFAHIRFINFDIE